MPLKRLLLTTAAMFCALTAARAVPVTPIVQPHMTFVNASGGPCAGCKLSTFTAGTTTPLATYTDASGTSVNTNPITLDAAGGANIWLGRNSYKFILKDALGNTIWTVDQVNAATLFPCSPANTIQIANSGVNGLTCDSTITIDTINHTLNVGTMSANHVTIGALGTPTSWFFDTTTPATALASLGGGSTGSGTANQLAFYAVSGNVITGTSVIPSLITATTQLPNDRSTKLATTAYVATPGAINPLSVQIAAGVAMTDNQGNGLKVQHSTGTTTTGNGAMFDADGNVVDSGAPASTAPFSTLTDVTGSRTLSTAYHNTGTKPMLVIGYAQISAGSGDSTIACNVGVSSPSSDIWANITTATVAGSHVGFSCIVPPGYFYSITSNNLITSIGRWVEEQ